MLLLLLALSLFDGQTLAGWSATGDASWRVAENTIIASGDGDGFLTTTAEFTDFRLSLEFWVDSTTNSGVLIRCGRRDRIHPDFCLELNIWDEHPRPEARTGAIVFRVMPPLVRVETVGRWNRLQVTARGNIVELTINGKVTARLEDAGSTGGFVALQHAERGVVKFRNIEILVLED